MHPREVVKEALAQNAAAVVLAHNHPSGVSEPSQADELITARLKEALGLLDIRGARPRHRGVASVACPLRSAGSSRTSGRPAFAGRPDSISTQFRPGSPLPPASIEVGFPKSAPAR